MIAISPFRARPLPTPAPAAAVSSPSPPTPRIGRFDADYHATLTKMAFASPEAALSAKPLRDGRAAFAERVALVNAAKSSIVCTTYAIVHDRYGVEYLLALAAAARRGVKVIVALDAVSEAIGGSRGATEPEAYAKALRELEDAGGFVTWYATPQHHKKNLGAGNHLKALVVDGMSAIVGGRNTGKEYVEDWTDFEELLVGPIAARVSERAQQVLRHSHPFLRRQQTPELKERYLRALAEIRFDANVAAIRGRRLVSEARARGESVTAPMYFVTWDPTYGRSDYPMVPAGMNPVTEALIATIERAASSITLSSNYVWGVDALQEALMRAARRGVRVTVVTTGEAASPGVALACYLGTREQYAAMMSAGIRILETRRHEHGKMYVVDDTIAAFGSYNVEYPAHDKLVEGLIFTADSGIVRDVKRALEETMRESTEASLALPPMSLSERFWRFLMMLFDLIFHLFV